MELSSRNSVQAQQNQIATLTQKRRTLEVSRELTQAQLEQAEVNLKRTQVTSPLTGTIIENMVEQGDYVRKGDPLVRISDSTRIEIACNLRVEEIYWIWLQGGLLEEGRERPAGSQHEVPRTPAEVVFEFDGMEFRWAGELSRYAGTGLDPSTRTVPCRVLVSDPTGGRMTRGAGISPPTLISGMFVTVHIPIQPPAPMLAIPASALRPGEKVWLASDGKLRIAEAKVAHMENDQALLVSIPGGPQAGDTIITSPIAIPTDGMKVRSVDAPNN